MFFNATVFKVSLSNILFPVQIHSSKWINFFSTKRRKKKKTATEIFENHRYVPDLHVTGTAFMCPTGTSEVKEEYISLNILYSVELGGIPRSWVEYSFFRTFSRVIARMNALCSLDIPVVLISTARRQLRISFRKHRVALGRTGSPNIQGAVIQRDARATGTAVCRACFD